MKILNLIPEAYALVAAGEKTMEGRLGYVGNNGISPGDVIYFQCRALERGVRVRVSDVQQHIQGTTFQDVVTEANYRQLVPVAKSPDEAIRIYDSLCPRIAQKRHGVVLFSFELL